MKEYQLLLDSYVKLYSPSRIIPKSDIQNITVSEKYMSKYWLSDSEYGKIWKPIEIQIFLNTDNGFPQLTFLESYNIIAVRGGVLFTKESFDLLLSCFREVGDEYFVVIENSFGGRLKDAPLKFKYPTTITWSEMVSGGSISLLFIEMLFKEYFVYSESGKCAKYAANDYESPLGIIAFKKEYKNLFKEKFEVSQEEREEIYNEWLPENYKDRVIDN